MTKTAIFLTSFIIILIDQASKIWVKTHMMIGDKIEVIEDFFYINFTENRGMAFGWEFGGDLGKLALTAFRIIAVGFIIYMINQLHKNKAHKGFLLAMSLVLAGAIGNILDSVFYGVFFSDSLNKIATVFPEDGGYAKPLYGHVVDMFYFPIWSGRLPEWIPVIGGSFREFFPFVFNVADTAISIGITILLLFNRTFFKEENDLKLSEIEKFNREEDWQQVKNEVFKSKSEATSKAQSYQSEYSNSATIAQQHQTKAKKPKQNQNFLDLDIN